MDRNLRKTEHGWLATRTIQPRSKNAGITTTIYQVVFAQNGDGKAHAVHKIRKREGVLFVDRRPYGDEELPKWLWME